MCCLFLDSNDQRQERRIQKQRAWGDKKYCRACTSLCNKNIPNGVFHQIKNTFIITEGTILSAFWLSVNHSRRRKSSKVFTVYVIDYVHVVFKQIIKRNFERTSVKKKNVFVKSF